MAQMKGIKRSCSEIVLIFLKGFAEYMPVSSFLNLHLQLVDTYLAKPFKKIKTNLEHVFGAMKNPVPSRVPPFFAYANEG